MSCLGDFSRFQENLIIITEIFSTESRVAFLMLLVVRCIYDLGVISAEILTKAILHPQTVTPQVSTD